MDLQVVGLIAAIGFSLFNVMVTIGGFAWFGGKLTGRFEGHEILDAERFKQVEADLKEIKAKL